MSLQIIRSNITDVQADAIVNSANPNVAVGGGVDSAIYESAGQEELYAERIKIGKIECGQAVITPAFNLKAKYIIHTVGPIWQGGSYGECEKLKLCYINSLELAIKNECESVALPLISSGIYGFPKDRALQIAIASISEFLLDNELNVILVVFDTDSFELSGKLFDGIDEYIDDNLVYDNMVSEYSTPYLINELPAEDEYSSSVKKDKDKKSKKKDTREGYFQRSILKRSTMPAESDYCLHPDEAPVRSLDDIMNQVGESFQERLLRLIDERKLSDVEVYKKANLDRKLFSKIRCNPEYKPKKKTALALAIALRLNIDETNDLLKRAELALSPSSKADLIIEYFIENEVYDVYTINMALFKHEQPLLGE